MSGYRHSYTRGTFREGVPWTEVLEVERYGQPICICEHEEHDGECPELVGGKHAFPCGCDDYTPNREVVGTES